MVRIEARRTFYSRIYVLTRHTHYTYTPVYVRAYMKDMYVCTRSRIPSSFLFL